MKLFQVSSVDEARETLLRCAGECAQKTLTIPLLQGYSQILAQDIYAGENIPSFRRSTVDGYAVIAGDTAAASDSVPVFLKLCGEVEMGCSADFRIAGGECAYVPTGGMLPEGADAVVMIEYCESFGAEDIIVSGSVAFNENVVAVGEDVLEGSLLLKRGTLLSPKAIGALAAAGISDIPVRHPLRLSLVSTGDELIAPKEIPKAGQVRDINTYALKALAEKNHYTVLHTHILEDNEALLTQTLLDLIKESDVICISGGSSQGEKDITEKVIHKIASPGTLIHGLALKPGKPTILGFDDASKTIFAGLPGHPVSAIMVFELLFSWLTRQLFDIAAPLPIPAIISQGIPGSPGKTTCQPVRLSTGGNGYEAIPIFGKSGLITTLTQADGYIIIDRNAEGLKAGAAVEVHRL